MDEIILKKLEQRLDRRSFLRGSGLAAAAIAGMTAFPGLAFGQSSDAAKSQDAKKDDASAGSAQSKADSDKKEEAKKEDAKDEKKEEQKDAKNNAKEAPDPFKETKKDEQGRDFRLCPQCGYNMYKQDRTWTCENCGYSYVE